MIRSLLMICTCCALLIGAGCGSDEDKGTSQSSTSTSTSTTATTIAKKTVALPRGSEPVELDPADFTTRIDNPYWPMPRGARWVYTSNEERIVVRVTNKKKRIKGVNAIVLRDTVTARGSGTLVEVTDDWYAQDSEGNVWYLGEDTKEYKNGKVSSTEGSWEHGVDGAYAGVIMPAKPRRGVAYRQEYYKGQAEDRARILSVKGKVTVPAGRFTHSVKTAESTPLEPGLVEYKYYAKGVGNVLRTSKSGAGREELVSYRK